MSGVGSSPTSGMSPYQACDTSQILVAGVPDGFSRESPVFFVFIYLFFFFFFWGGGGTHSFVISHAREIIKL